MKNNCIPSGNPRGRVKSRRRWRNSTKNNGFINYTREIYRIFIQDHVEEVSLTWVDSVKMGTGMDNITCNIIKKMMKGS